MVPDQKVALFWAEEQFLHDSRSYNCPGLSGTVPPVIKWSRGVGALLLELPHRETAPVAPLIGTPLLYHRGREKKGMPIRGAKKEERK